MSAKLAVASLAVLAIVPPLVVGIETPLAMGAGFAVSSAILWWASRLRSQLTELSPLGLVIVTPFRRLRAPWPAVASLGSEGYSLITLRNGVRFRTNQYEYRGIGTRWLAHHTRAFRPYTQYMPTMTTFWKRYCDTGPAGAPEIDVRWPRRGFWASLLLAGAAGELLGVVIARLR